MVGMQELVIIFAVALLIFGPRQLPKLGRSLGEAVRGLRSMHEEDADEERDD